MCIRDSERLMPMLDLTHRWDRELSQDEQLCLAFARIVLQTPRWALIDDSLDGAGSLELALIENVAREDLTVIEEARTIAMLLDDLHVTRTLLASRLGRSRSDLAHHPSPGTT